MGTAACGSMLNHDKSNNSAASGIDQRSRGFCTLALVTDGFRASDRFCKGINSDNEWESDFSIKRPCFYNSYTGDTRSTASFGCCGLECAIAGTSYDCKRKAFRGRPKMCCYRDYACSGVRQDPKKGLGFDSSSEMRSCPPDNQDLTSTSCQAIISEDCSNLDNNPTSQWRANWLSNRTVTETATPANTGGNMTEDLSYTTPNNPICVHALWRNVYGVNSFGCQGEAPDNVSSGIQVIPTASGIAFGRKMMNDMYATYVASGGSLIAREDQQVDTELNNLIYNICSNTPGLCTDILQNVCATVTIEDLKNRPNIQKICGCYLSSGQYSRYENLYNISRECTPSCNVPGVIPLVDETGIQLKKCKQSVCIIDKVAIDLYQSRVGDSSNGITINQICSSCGDPTSGNTGHCNCQLNNLTVISAQATISGGINISQQCGSTTCSLESTDTLGNVTTTQVPCSSDGVTNPATNPTSATVVAKATAEKFKRTKILILLGIVIVILVIVWLIFTFNRPAIENTIIYTRVPLPKKIDTLPVL